MTVADDAPAPPAGGRAPDEAERFYDERIAPVLMDLCRLCSERGLPFLAVVEFGPDLTGRTEWSGASPGPKFRLASAAARSGGNFDLLAMALARGGELADSVVARLAGLEREGEADARAS